MEIDIIETPLLFGLHGISKAACGRFCFFGVPGEVSSAFAAILFVFAANGEGTAKVTSSPERVATPC